LNKNIKYLGLLAMIPLFTVALTIGSANLVNAENMGSVGGPADQTTKNIMSLSKYD